MKNALKKLLCGNPDLTPYVILKDEKVVPKYSVVRNDKSKTISFYAEYNALFRDDLHFQLVDDEFICKRTFANISNAYINFVQFKIQR